MSGTLKEVKRAKNNIQKVKVLGTNSLEKSKEGREKTMVRLIHSSLKIIGVNTNQQLIQKDINLERTGRHREGLQRGGPGQARHVH